MVIQPLPLPWLGFKDDFSRLRTEKLNFLEYQSSVRLVNKCWGHPREISLPSNRVLCILTIKDSNLRNTPKMGQCY